jgi:membrane protein implicated in regulation of membrane protease activity
MDLPRPPTLSTLDLVDGFLEWAGDNAWAGWVAFAVILGIVETTTLDLVFLMLAGGAVAGAIAAAFGAPLLLQAVVAVVASAALLGVVRPVAQRHLRTPLEVRTGVAALVGRDALVTQRVDAHTGQVKLAGEIWSARAFDDHEVIEPGERVQVAEIEGATALVFRSGL